jgi:hypothetical protein
MTKNVLISVPFQNNLSIYQNRLKTEFLDKLAQDGITPHVFGEIGAVNTTKNWSIDALLNFMQGCDGVVVLGLIRHECGHVTEYNHMEGALALAYRLPLLVIHEEGALGGGILYKNLTSNQTDIIPTPAIPVNSPAGWFNTDAQFNTDYDDWRNSL